MTGNETEWKVSLENKWVLDRSLNDVSYLKQKQFEHYYEILLFQNLIWTNPDSIIISAALLTDTKWKTIPNYEITTAFTADVDINKTFWA